MVVIVSSGNGDFIIDDGADHTVLLMMISNFFNATMVGVNTKQRITTKIVKTIKDIQTIAIQ